MTLPLLETLNVLPASDAASLLRQCCGASVWCEQVLLERPFHQPEHLHEAADRVFDQLSESGWIEAFQSHPKLGDLESLKMKFSGNQRWSAGEQAGVSQADEATLRALAELNLTYEARFGYIFILCASGKSAAQMLASIEARIVHDAETELRVAAAEQRKITHLRIDKLLQSDL